MQNRVDARKVGCRKDQMQNRSDAGQDRYRTGQMQNRMYAGQVRCRIGWIQDRSDHRRSKEEEAKANRRRCFLGENCRAHGLFTICVADKLIKGGQGQNGGGIFVYYIF